MSRIDEVKEQLKEVAEELYLYDSSYTLEVENARNKWNDLMDVISREKLNIDWRDYLAHYNCEGEKLW